MTETHFFAYRSFWPQPDTVRQFAELGVDTVCIYPANTLNSLGIPYSNYPPNWLDRGHYDFAPLDQQIAELREANPALRLLCMIDLNSPHWWVRQNCYAGGHDTFHALGKVASWPKWRDDTRDYLQAFLRHTEARHADTISAYVLSCGGTCEWYDHSQGEESASRRAAFREWAIGQGLDDPVDVPPASARDRVSHDLLRDPEADALAVHYWRFVNGQIGDTILHFARAAQQIVQHRAELGIFYGYILELGARRLVAEGHLAYERLLDAPELDFFIAPATYQEREMGGPSAFLSPVASFQHHGKRFVQELDHRTHTARPPRDWYGAAFNIWHTEAETIAGLRREFAYALIEGVSLWWFDMWGGFYEGENVLAALAQMKRLWQLLADRDDEPAAQIAVVVDPESALYTDQGDPRVNGFIRDLRGRLGRVGAPYKAFSFCDLATVDLAPYRLVIFPNLFVVDEARRRLLAERVCCGGRTVLWFYRPGVIADGRYGEANVERLAGIPMHIADVTAREMDGWTSVLSPSPELSPAQLRALAADAGVHTYCDAAEPVYASRRLLACHTATGGRRRFRLPCECSKVTELFSGRLVAEHASTFDDDLPAPSTVLYRLD